MATVQTFTSVFNQLLPEPHAGLLSGILFGIKATLARDLYKALVMTGSLHIVALSGMNITILTGLVNLGLLQVVSRRIASLLTIIIIAGFVWFVGFSPSVVRAAIMGEISLLAVIFGRQYWALLSWLLAVGIMLLLNFNWIVDLSFQLSALATLGIILFGQQRGDPAGPAAPDTRAEVGTPWFLHRQGPDPSFVHHLSSAKAVTVLRKRAPPRAFFDWRVTSWLARLISDDLRLTLAAQVFTIPLILWHFHRISLVSPLTNVLIGWTLAPLTVLGWVIAAWGWVFLPLAQPVAWIAWVLLEYLVTVVRLTATIPLASLSW